MEPICSGVFKISAESFSAESWFSWMLQCSLRQETQETGRDFLYLEVSLLRLSFDWASVLVFF